MGVRVKDPRQNTHRWTGTLLKGDKKVMEGIIVKPKDLVIFVKTSRDAHFVAEGTFVKRFRMLSSSGNASEAIEAIKATELHIPPGIFRKIDRELKSYKVRIPIVEILEIDFKATSPLVKALNVVTGNLFSDDEWLRENGKGIGIIDIKIGRQLPPLPC